MIRRIALSTAAAAVLAMSCADAGAQTLGTATPVAAPLSPAIVSRDATGHITIRAVRVAPAIHVDGTLDEAIYQTTEPISGFVQQEPDEGKPATERTDAWVLFDAQNVYVPARCWDTHHARI